MTGLSHACKMLFATDQPNIPSACEPADQLPCHGKQSGIECAQVQGHWGASASSPGKRKRAPGSVSLVQVAQATVKQEVSCLAIMADAGAHQTSQQIARLSVGPKTSNASSAVAMGPQQDLCCRTAWMDLCHFC